MKKIVLSLTMLVVALTASAQFQQGKGYIGASLSGLNLSYNSENGLNLGVQAKAGYLFADNWMLLGEVGYDHYGKDKIADQAAIGVGFRYYIIQNGQSTLMTLDEELKFIEAYSYLFEIRYADKLFFDIDVDDKYRSWTLPALSLQPLIGNAVKHNTITRSKPFHISIRTEQGWLVVANPKVPKIEPEPSTGIGLENLRNRWHLITGRDIEIIDTDKEFVVRMPLQKPVIG
jgi:hypothetical protein